MVQKIGRLVISLVMSVIVVLILFSVTSAGGWLLLTQLMQPGFVTGLLKLLIGIGLFAAGCFALYFYGINAERITLWVENALRRSVTDRFKAVFSRTRAAK